MTMIPKHELSAEDMRNITQQTVQRHLSLEAHGYRCDSEMLVDVLLKAASENSSVKAACADLVDVADSHTIRESLNQQFEVGDLWQQEVELNQALAAHIPAAMQRGGVEIAIDFHVEQLYGVVMAIPTHHPPQSVIY